jgi:flagellar protein FlbD
MIKVTRLDGSELFVNSDLLEFVEQCPDTVLSLVHGRKLVVKENSNQIVERVVEFKRSIVRQDSARQTNENSDSPVAP